MMKTSLLILLCWTFLQAFGSSIEQDEAQPDAPGWSPLVIADNSADRTEVADATVPVSLEDVIEQLLQQQAVIQHLQAEMDQKTKAVEQAFRQEIKALQQRSIYRCERGTLAIPSYGLSNGSGWRHHDLTATFSRSFGATPVVTIGLTKLDNSRNLRVDASVIYRYASHMIVRIQTWSDTMLYSARVDWMACA